MTTAWPGRMRSPQGTWKLLWAAVTAQERACTECGSDSVRRSGIRTPLPLRCAGLRLWRCRDCSALFPLRRRGLD